MTEDIKSLLLTEMFTPNCRITVSGEHFFADRKLYTNPYGIAFFSSSQDYCDNPHISPAISHMPGILDDYFAFFPTLRDSYVAKYCNIRNNIMKTVDKKFTVSKKVFNPSPCRLDCSYLGNISVQAGNSIVIQYGAVMPGTVCITGEDTVSAVFPFSPFSNISFLKEKRTMQSVDYPVSNESFLLPDDITVDFSVNTKKLSCSIRDDLTGSLELDYTVEVGAVKCENSKIKFEISKLYDINKNI